MSHVGRVLPLDDTSSAMSRLVTHSLFFCNAIVFVLSLTITLILVPLA